jgi:hypothetical protein
MIAWEVSMDRYQLKDAIRSLLPQSRLIYRVLAIMFLLALVISCWPQALAKILFLPSDRGDLQGTWESADNYITFEGSYIGILSKIPCSSLNGSYKVAISDQLLTFSEPPAQQSYRLLPSLGDMIQNGKSMHLLIEGPGPIPEGMYTDTGVWVNISCDLNP